MRVIQIVRQRKSKVCTREYVLSESAVYGIACEDRLIAQVLHIMTTVPAVSIRSAHPGDANACSKRQLGSRTVNYFPDNLMTGNKAGMDWRQIALDDVQVGSANTTRKDTKDNIARLNLGARNVLNP